MNLKVIKCDGIWRAYCYYCDHDITPPDGNQMNGWFDCLHCPIVTRFIVSGDISNPEINMVHLRCWEWLIELVVDDNYTNIFDENDRQFVTLNYIPKITPTTAKPWLERVVQLKAFA